MKKITALQHNQKGFTLIELLVVILIIGVLAAALLALIDPIGKVQQAQDAGFKDFVSQVASAQNSYYSQQLGVGTGKFAVDVPTLNAAKEITQSLVPNPYATSWNMTCANTAGGVVACGSGTDVTFQIHAALQR